MTYPRTTSLDFLERCSPNTAAFYRYWDSKRRGRAMPARADLDPVEMKRWLPGIILVSVLYDPFCLVYRLVGERPVQMRNSNPTGMTVQEGYHGSSLDDVLENYRLVVEEKTPVYDWDHYPSRSGYLRESETLLLPLSSDGEIVDMVVIYLEVASNWPA